ncbi:MAG TPA: hypothetical protein V6C64_01140 [Microcoleaceae cyanobacterium]
MPRWLSHAQPSQTARCLTGVLLSLAVLAPIGQVMAHAEHSNEFQGGSQPTQAAGAIQVDADTTRRMGLEGNGHFGFKQ